MIPVTLADILLDQNSGWSALLLRGSDSPRFLAFQVHAYEACEAAAAFAQPPSVRPRSVEFWGGALTALDVEVEYSVIHSIETLPFPPFGEFETFIAKLVLRRDGELIELDARPSDAIPITVLRRRPLYVSEALLAQSEVVIPPELEATLGVGIKHIIHLLHPPDASDPSRQDEEAAARADYARERSVRKLIAHLAPAPPPASSNKVAALREWWKVKRRRDSEAGTMGRKSGMPIPHEGAHPDAVNSAGERRPGP